LDSHEIVRRQLLHYNRMDLPDSVEILFVDDGSDPPLDGDRRVTVHRTNDTRKWTEHIARNKGAQLACGEYLLMIDIDYIVPRETILRAIEFNGERMEFDRRFGGLDEEGKLDTSIQTLAAWGLLPKWQRRRTPNHRSQYLMHKSLFDKIGGYREDRWGKAHPRGGGAGQEFFHKWLRLNIPLPEERPVVYMFPNGKYCGNVDSNPFGLFHSLMRKA